jgi:predicted GTPase
MKKVVKLKESDLINIIKRVIKEQEMEENRLDFGNMSDEELHNLHPHIKKHPKHFKNFTPTSEYLGWKGEVDKRGIYKRRGKFHNAFPDNKKED